MALTPTPSPAPSSDGQSLRSPGCGFLKALLACCLGSSALWLFPAVGQAQPCIKTHASLKLGCLTREQWDRQIREWSARYREKDYWTVEPLVEGEGGPSKLPGWEWWRKKRDGSGRRPLAGINADRAYAHVKALMGEDVKPGQGVTIGFYDFSVHPNPWFEDTKLTNKIRIDRLFDGGWSIPANNHGLMVAATAAGRGGVAPGANVTVFNYNSVPTPNARPRLSRGGRLETDELWENHDDRRSAYFKHILEHDIDIFSYSYSTGLNIEHYVQGGDEGSNVRKNFRKTLNVLAQKNAKEKTIFIWAAGNEGIQGGCESPNPGMCTDRGGVNASSPELMAGLSALAPELRSHSIAAVAAHYHNDLAKWIIAGYSNRCGIAADWCITAPVGLQVPAFIT